MSRQEEIYLTIFFRRIHAPVMKIINDVITHYNDQLSGMNIKYQRLQDSSQEDVILLGELQWGDNQRRLIDGQILDCIIEIITGVSCVKTPQKYKTNKQQNYNNDFQESKTQKLSKKLLQQRTEQSFENHAKNKTRDVHNKKEPIDFKVFQEKEGFEEDDDTKQSMKRQQDLYAIRPDYTQLKYGEDDVIQNNVNNIQNDINPQIHSKLLTESIFDGQSRPPEGICSGSSKFKNSIMRAMEKNLSGK